MPGQIEENQELILENLLSFRLKAAQTELQTAAARVGQFVETQARKNGPTISVTWGIEQGEVGQPVLDTEILIPLEGDFTPPEGCTRKPLLKIVNAVKVRHTGNPAMLQTTLNLLTMHISQRNLTPITSAYIVTVKEVKTAEELNGAIMDVYIGVSPNVL
jgi:hypothetical protein